MANSMQTQPSTIDAVEGFFCDIDNERFYAIKNVDAMPPFFISVVSHGDHWLFASSNGALTAGRISPDTSLFPYVTVDKIHDSVGHTGVRTLLQIEDGGDVVLWEPFKADFAARCGVTRSIYKHVLGNQLRFEETHDALQLRFHYTWQFSTEFGFVRRCGIDNLGNKNRKIRMLDGLLNVLPAGTPKFAQTNTSNLVDAYKWSELDEDTSLASFTLYSGITDRAEPCESLRANIVYTLGLIPDAVTLSDTAIDTFQRGESVHGARISRGVRGNYLIQKNTTVKAGKSLRWTMVADIEKDQSQVVAYLQRLRDLDALQSEVAQSLATGSDELARTLAAADGFQCTNEEAVSVHHYANTLFNVLRGGIFDDHYTVTSRDFARTVGLFDNALQARLKNWFGELPEVLSLPDLRAEVVALDEPQLLRLCQEYLPIRFGRRHGDPSRPWNQFAIELNDEAGHRILSYQGNWRDIFQNWEALALSYPLFIDNIIAKFVNASTLDGYNPYRITDEGIDWEVEDPEDPWSYIGYWGDHQIIYLLKLLEWSQRFQPERLTSMLMEPLYCYANVPYRIKSFDALVEDPKNTVEYDDAAAELIETRVAARGADGKLVYDDDDTIYLVTLLEKLLVPLLSKLGNLVVDAGIWLNTQRPEWNDANNALVGQGASMVTLYYMQRYVTFLKNTLQSLPSQVELSHDVALWLDDTVNAMTHIAATLGDGMLDDTARYDAQARLGIAASAYRERVFAQPTLSHKSSRPVSKLTQLLDDTAAVIQHSIGVNRRADGLYHAYNTLAFGGNDDPTLTRHELYPMLEGQVAALSSGVLPPAESRDILRALFASNLYRDDQQSFMLYPDRSLPNYLDRNRLHASEIRKLGLVKRMQSANDTRLFTQDPDGTLRFNADLANAADLQTRLETLTSDYPGVAHAAREPLMQAFESVFNHQAFTGRSGTMFGFEGLGCIYWHMVSKLLVAVQEAYRSACEQGATMSLRAELASQYYAVRDGLSFNKTPQQYGAFPMDPYSHTPGHSGAQQPGMTGQVKEEILTRLGELGVHIDSGCIVIEPSLLRQQEFLQQPSRFRYLDVQQQWQDVDLQPGMLAFTWCQVPFIYTRDLDARESSITAQFDDGSSQQAVGLALSRNASHELFSRSGRIRCIHVVLTSKDLMSERGATE
ncbi:MAG: hypothetical protein AAGA84_00650 [Pseudomonadota bacterium]